MEDSTYKNELTKRINEILLNVWDPIGIGATPEAHREYDTYGSHVWELVLRGSSKEEISTYLAKIMQEQMGLEPNQEHNNVVAELACDWRDALQEAEQLGIPASDTCYISADKDSDASYHATDISDKLVDFLNFEYVDTLNKEWQIWAYPGGVIYDVRPDRIFSPTDLKYHSHPGDGDWNIELVKNNVDKLKVNEAYNQLKDTLS